MKLLKTMLLQDNSPPKTKIKNNFLTIKTNITMKTFKLFMAIALLSFLTSNAQITKGNWMFGGSASYNNKEIYNKNFSNDKGRTTEIEVTANAGYFIIDKLQAGTRISYEHFSRKGDEGSSRYWLKYGVYTRYYLLKPEKMVNFFLDGQYFLGNKAFSDGDFKDKLNGYVFSAGPTIFFNSSVAMELGINYSSTKFNGANDNIIENNLQFSLGFQIFLEKQ